MRTESKCCSNTSYLVSVFYMAVRWPSRRPLRLVLDLSWRSRSLKRDRDRASHPPQDGLNQSELKSRNLKVFSKVLGFKD